MRRRTRAKNSDEDNRPDGMRKRIDDEVPKWRDIVAKAGIKPV